jgi:hypothetical protein
MNEYVGNLGANNQLNRQIDGCVVIIAVEHLSVLLSPPDICILVARR